MKSILTLLFVVVLGAAAMANPQENHDEISPIKVGLVLDGSTISADNHKTIKTSTDQEIARLYRRKNTLVKKALNFRTKRSNTKLA